MLKGKTVVITGASRGLGEAIASVCAREGAWLVLGYHEQGQRAAELARRLDARALKLDVRHPQALEEACAPLFEGGVDGWVNNAGVHHGGLLPTQDQASIEEQLAVNLLGPIYCCRVVLPHMLERRRGSIVNIGSVARQGGTPGQSVYAATKGGVAAFTRALASEYGRLGIRVNCVEPGPMQTEMLESTRQLVGEGKISQSTALRRLGQPLEVAELVAFLLSDRASYLTGGLFPADGGYSR